MVFLITLLADHGMHNSLEDVFFWENAFHVFDQLVGLVHFFVLEVIDDQIKTSFWNDIDQGWKNLKSIFSTTENDQIVSQ